MAKKKRSTGKSLVPAADYDGLLGDVVSLLETARRTSARAVNAVMTATYWEIGRRVVEMEQGGAGRADYGQELLKRLASDLTARFGRGFSDRTLYKMRLFYLSHVQISPTVSAKSAGKISPTPSANLPVGARANRQTPSVESTTPTHVSGDARSFTRFSETESHAKLAKNLDSQILPTVSAKFAAIQQIARVFPLPWSHYVKLLGVKDENARRFYEEEALRGGWSVRQLDRQIGSQFYERTLLSKNKSAMLRKGAEPQAGDLVSPEDEIKDPFVLEFLNLKDEYSEYDLEEALIHKLEDFLLELGGDFAFIGRQKRLRIGDEWYRIDLLFFHRRLRCLVVIDLKVGKFTHADAGQMHLYLNYAREHWTHNDENPPVGLILCAQKDEAVAHYSLENLPNKVMAAEYRLALPDEKLLESELVKTQRELEVRGITSADGATHATSRRSHDPNRKRSKRKR